MKLDRFSLFIGAAFGALALALVSAFGLGITSTGAQPAPVEVQVSELRQMAAGAEAAAQKAQVVAVVYQLDMAGFHGLEENVTAGQIPAGALGSVRRARIAVEATAWPAPLRDTAASLAKEMIDLEAALRDENVDSAKAPAHEVHEVGHTLSDQAYAWLGSSRAPASDDHNMDDHDHDDHDHSH